MSDTGVPEMAEFAGTLDASATQNSAWELFLTKLTETGSNGAYIIVGAGVATICYVIFSKLGSHAVSVEQSAQDAGVKEMRNTIQIDRKRIDKLHADLQKAHEKTAKANEKANTISRQLEKLKQQHEALKNRCQQLEASSNPKGSTT